MTSSPPGVLTRRFCAATLLAQAMSVFFGALVGWQLMTAHGAPERGRLALWVGVGLAVLCLVAAGLLRSRLGMPLGWACQALTLLSAIFFRPMLVVGLIFAGLWWASLHHGRRIDDDRDRWAAQAVEADEAADPTSRPAAPHTPLTEEP